MDQKAMVAATADYWKAEYPYVCLIWEHLIQRNTYRPQQLVIHIREHFAVGTIFVLIPTIIFSNH
jgi:hypothetical protein